jgi:DNA-binding beta-propeller fold protein YncE
MKRRDLLLAAGPFGWGKKRGTGSDAVAYIANQLGRSVAAVNLNSFSVTAQAQLGVEPGAVLAHPSLPTVYVLAPDKGVIFELDAERLSTRRSLRVEAPARGLRLSPDGRFLWVLSSGARALVRIAIDSFQASGAIRLPAPAIDFDLESSGNLAAIAFGGGAALADTRTFQIKATVPAVDPRVIRFRSDGRQVLIGDRSARALRVLDAASARVVVNLPLPVAPENFCFKSDGGELFVTGGGMDAVVVVYPYRTEVRETVLAGRAPRWMAVSTSPELLLVANPEAGDVTILEIETVKLVAVVTVGSETGEIAVTPDSQYALVLNRQSGHLAVIGLWNATTNRSKTAPLFTTIPVGARPVALAVRAV